MKNKELTINIGFISHKDLLNPSNAHMLPEFAALKLGVDFNPDNSGMNVMLSNYMKTAASRGNSIVYAKANERIIGVMNFFLSADDKDIQLKYGAVAPEYRGREIHAEIINYIERHGKGFLTMSAEVFAENTSSQNSLTKLGFSHERIKKLLMYKKDIDPEKALHTFNEAPPQRIIIPPKSSTKEAQNTKIS